MASGDDLVMTSDGVSDQPVNGFNVANLARLCHKRNLIARLIKGCRVDVRAIFSFQR
jgi:hypothetical protein